MSEIHQNNTIYGIGKDWVADTNYTVENSSVVKNLKINKGD
jgi:hypothetical protein